jgi:hypothetical protein
LVLGAVGVGYGFEVEWVAHFEPENTYINKCFKQKSNVLYNVGNSPHKKYDSLKIAAVP